MKTMRKKILSVTLVLCLALAVASLAYATGACPKCGGSLNEVFRPHYIYTSIVPHDFHMDYIYYDVALLDISCSKCNYRTEEIKAIYKQIDYYCPGFAPNSITDPFVVK